MTTKVEYISKKGYNLIGRLDDEQDALESFNEHSGYICDAISAIADNYIPIYNHDVWENASTISDYIEDAIEEGLAPVESGNTDLIKIFQSGYYVYYNQSLYNNLDEMSFNYVVDKVNEAISSLDEETQNAIDLSEVEEAIESETDSFDNNNTYDDLDDIANTIIDSINEGEYVK